jgi:hypothetical protein
MDPSIKGNNADLLFMILQGDLSLLLPEMSWDCMIVSLVCTYC